MDKSSFKFLIIFVFLLYVFSLNNKSDNEDTKTYGINI